MIAKALVPKFDHIERIERLVVIAEARRNATLREIDRHRATFAQVSREGAHDVEEAEFKIIKPKAATLINERNKNAA